MPIVWGLKKSNSTNQQALWSVSPQRSTHSDPLNALSWQLPCLGHFFHCFIHPIFTSKRSSNVPAYLAKSPDLTIGEGPLFLSQLVPIVSVQQRRSFPQSNDYILFQTESILSFWLQRLFRPFDLTCYGFNSLVGELGKRELCLSGKWNRAWMKCHLCTNFYYHIVDTRKHVN